MGSFRAAERKNAVKPWIYPGILRRWPPFCVEKKLIAPERGIRPFVEVESLWDLERRLEED